MRWSDINSDGVLSLSVIGASRTNIVGVWMGTFPGVMAGLPLAAFGFSALRNPTACFKKSERGAPGLKAPFGSRILRGPKGPRFHRRPERNVFATSSTKLRASTRTGSTSRLRSLPWQRPVDWQASGALGASLKHDDFGSSRFQIFKT